MLPNPTPSTRRSGLFGFVKDFAINAVYSLIIFRIFAEVLAGWLAGLLAGLLVDLLAGLLATTVALVKP